MEKNLLKRLQIVHWYDEYIPEKHQMPTREVPWVYDLKVPVELQQTIVRNLNNQGIQARFGFRPMSEQSEYGGVVNPQLLAHRYSRQIIYLPIDLRMTCCDVQKVCGALTCLLS